MKLFTIGFTQKRAEEFFELLKQNGIEVLIDIRLNPGGQLSGFAKQEDLAYFLNLLADGCQYVHLPELAPTKEILTDYRNDKDWDRYEARFETLMDERSISQVIFPYDLKKNTSCLLCSETTPEKCHRRLVAERLAKFWPDIEVIHL